MIRLLVLIVLFLTNNSSFLQADPQTAPYAVVRLSSHGASGTVIHTEPGRSLILSCGHAFEGADRRRPITLDVPVPETSPRPPKHRPIELRAVDYAADLSLLILADGPLPYVAPVAPRGFQPGRLLLSVGYDEMRLPATQRSATLLEAGLGTTFTVERPWHGRSGGALLDREHGYLVGVVQGYEVTGRQRGMYVAHAAILRFLEKLPATPIPPARNCPT